MFSLLKSLAIFVFGVIASIFIISGNPVTEDISQIPTKNSPLTETEKATSTEIITETGEELEIPENVTKNREVSESETVTVPEPKILKKEDVKTEIENIVTTLPIPLIKETTLSTSELNTKTRGALVNIICTTKTGGLISPITGSGIIISERGAILTNAHIAQYYLLKDYSTPDFLNCTIRTGSPAVNAYKAELLFISPAWVNGNYKKIAESNPKGTGENDFALLLITEATRPGAVLPDKFPFIPPDLREQKPQLHDPVIVAGYPAGFLGGTSIQKELYAVSTVTEVMDVFTFKETSLDLFSVGGNIAAQKGSSGGGVVSLTGKLLGIVVTATDAVQTADRDLRAITLSHINRSLMEEIGSDLNAYLFGDLAGKSSQFRTLIAPILTSLLESALAI
jgi:hypothetical protein